MAGVTISGAIELREILKGLTPKLEKKYIKAGIKAANKVVAQEAKRILVANQKYRAPRYRKDKATGAYITKTDKKGVEQLVKFKKLRYTIKDVVRRYKSGRKTMGVVGPTWPDGNHGLLVERGHVKFLWGKATGERVRPYPFLGPAFRNKKNEIQRIIRGKVRLCILDAAKK